MDNLSPQLSSSLGLPRLDNSDSSYRLSHTPSRQSLTDFGATFDPSFADPVQFSGQQEHRSSTLSHPRHSHGYQPRSQEPFSSLPNSDNSSHLRLPPMDNSPSLAEVLAYPVVQRMWNDLAEANRRIARALDSQDTLQKEILRLSCEIREINVSKHAYGT